MADLGGSRCQEPSDSSSWTRTSSTSEAIRKRVNQLLIATGAKVEPIELPPTSYAIHTRTKSDVKDSSAPASPTYWSHSLKRKKLSRTENKSGDSILDSALHSSKKGRSSISKHPYHQAQENRCYEDSSDDSAYIAAAEFDRMKKEIETLKAALHESKKTTKRQSKKIEDMKVEYNSASQALKDRDSKLTALKADNAKKEELVYIIETSVNCQICMDLPDKPFALAPCGHVLCLTCLQEWFRKAPPTLNDVDIDPEELTDPRYVLMRSKTCPSCRTVVRHRPIPAFMVKAIATALQKAKASSYSRSLHERNPDKFSDPWRGIFPSSDEEEQVEEDRDSSDDSDSDFDVADFRTTIYWHRRRALRRAMYRDVFTSAMSDAEDEENDSEDAEIASESDEVVESIRYVLPRWAPPTVYIDPGDFNLAEEQDPEVAFKLLQRGCTWEMVENHEMSYNHSSGIVLFLRSLNHLYASDDEGEAEIDGMNRIFLGWNVVLDANDIDGEYFINGILQDIKGTPSRWEITHRPGMPGCMDVRRLVPADEAANYNTTDTEAWNETDDF